MKWIYFLVVMTVVQGGPENLELPAPVMVGLEVTNNSLIVQWNKVDNSSEPVLGYIVKVWQLQDMVVYTIDDRYNVSVSETIKAVMDSNITPVEKPKDIKVEGANVTKAVIENFRTNMQYHIRVQAYSQNRQGPLSDATGIRLE